MNPLIPPYLTYLLIGLLVACGGGGGGGSGQTLPPGGFPPAAPTSLGNGLLSQADLTSTPAALMTSDPSDFALQKALFENSAEYQPRYIIVPNDGTTSSGSISITPQEVFTDVHLRRINAAAAYARGATGDDETVVVIDTALFETHPEFLGKSITERSSPPGYIPPRNIGTSHGTSVASVAVGVRDSRNDRLGIHGVAFDADLVFVNVPLGSGSGGYNPIDLSTVDSFRDRDFADSFGYGILNKLGFVINHSFGIQGGISRYSSAEVRAKLPQTAAVLAQADVDDADKQIVVWAAGNAGRQDTIDAMSPEIFAGLGAAFPELRSHILAVVALDQDGTIAAYSNRCGVAKSFCIAAPGSDILTAFTIPVDGYLPRDGTSFAAPIVTGALAVLRSYFRNVDGSHQLGNTELVRRLFATANKQGIYADSDIYGQGLVDLDAATAPVGDLMVGMLGDEGNRALAGSGITLSSPVFGTALQDQLAAIPMVGFDALGAPFSYSTANLATQPSRSTPAPILESRQTPLSATKYPSANTDDLSNARLSIAVDQYGTIATARLTAGRWWASYAQHGGQSLGLYAETGEPSVRAGRFGSTEPDDAQTHYLATRTMARRFSNPLAFAAPYMSLVRAGPGVGWSHSLSHGQRVSLALTHGTTWFAEQNTTEDAGGARGTGALLEYRLPNAGLSLQAGAVHEVDGFLGVRPHGAVGNVSGMTAFIGAGRAWGLGTPALRTPRWHVLTSAYFGHTQPQIKLSGLLRDTSDIFSSAFSLGISRTSLWQTNDWFGVRLTQPLRAERGTAKLRVAAGRSKYGKVLYQDHRVNLAPAGRNLQAEMAYRRPIAGGAFSTSLGIERHPQHNRTAGLQPFMRLSFEHRF